MIYYDNCPDTLPTTDAEQQREQRERVARFWAHARRCRDEVASWPWWKKGERAPSNEA